MEFTYEFEIIEDEEVGLLYLEATSASRHCKEFINANKDIIFDNQSDCMNFKKYKKVLVDGRLMDYCFYRSDEHTLYMYIGYADLGWNNTRWLCNITIDTDIPEDLDYLFVRLTAENYSETYIADKKEAEGVGAIMTFVFNPESFTSSPVFVNASEETDINKILFLLEQSINEGTEEVTPAVYPDYKVSLAKISYGPEYFVSDPNQYPSIAESLKHILDNYDINFQTKDYKPDEPYKPSN